MTIELTSFGYRHGRIDAPAVIDCRGLCNPHGVPGLGSLDGRAPAVRRFVRHDPSYRALIEEAMQHLRQANRLAFGCIGGRHRSVAMVEDVAALVAETGMAVRVTHRELVGADQVMTWS